MAHDPQYYANQGITPEAPSASLPRRLPDIGGSIAQAGQGIVQQELEIQQKKYQRWLNGEINRVRSFLQNSIMDLEEEFQKNSLYGQAYTDEFMRRFDEKSSEINQTLHEDARIEAESDILQLRQAARAYAQRIANQRESEYNVARINQESQTKLRFVPRVSSLEELNALKADEYAKYDKEVELGNIFPWQAQPAKDDFSAEANRIYIETRLANPAADLKALRQDLEHMEDLDPDVRNKTLEAIANEENRRERELYNLLQERIQAGEIIAVDAVTGLNDTKRLALKNYQKQIQRQLARERKQDELLARAEQSNRWAKAFYQDWWNGTFTQEEAIQRIDQAVAMDFLDPGHAFSLKNQIAGSQEKLNAIQYINQVIEEEKLPDPTNSDYRQAVDAWYQQKYIQKNRIPSDEELAAEITKTKIIPTQEISRMTGILAQENLNIPDLIQTITRADTLAKSAPEDFYKESNNPYLVYLQWAVNNHTLSMEDKAKKIMEFRLRYHDLPTRKQLEEEAKSADVDKAIDKLIKDGYLLSGIETRMQGPVRAQIKKYIPFGLIDGKDITEAATLAYDNLLQSRTGFGYSRAISTHATEIQEMLKKRDYSINPRIPSSYFSLGVFERITGASRLDIVMDDVIAELKRLNIYEPPQMTPVPSFTTEAGVSYLLDGPFYRLVADDRSASTNSFLIEKIDASGNVSPVYDANLIPQYYIFDPEKYQAELRKRAEMEIQPSPIRKTISKTIQTIGEMIGEGPAFLP